MRQQQKEFTKLERVERNLVTFRIDTLKSLLAKDVLEKEKINAILRQIFKAIHISIDKKFLEFEWQHSATRTCISFVNESAISVHKSSVIVGRLEPMPLPTIPKISLLDLAKNALKEKREKDALLD